MAQVWILFFLWLVAMSVGDKCLVETGITPQTTIRPYSPNNSLGERDLR